MSSNTVFILGAGASRAVSSNKKLPSPLATDFFKDNYLNHFMVSYSNNKFEKTKLNELIEHYFGPKDKINIEEIYSFLEFIENGFYSTFPEKINIKTAKNELIEYLFHLLNYEIEFESTYYEKIIKSLDDGDSILTFNWDLIIDQILNNSQKGKQLLNSLKEIINPLKTFENLDYDEVAYTNLHKGYFLKMHGSINWGLCENSNCFRSQIPFVFDIEKDFSHTFWNCNYCGSKINLLLMPPHIHKNFRTNRVFNLQAKIAYDKIKTAKKIIIIGYSFPEFDFEVSALFRKAKLSSEDDDQDSELFLKEIHIVDPAVKNPDFISKIKSIFGLERTKESYGHMVKLYKYENIDLFMKSMY